MYYKIKKDDVKDLFAIDNIELNANKLIINKFVNEGNVLKKDTDDIKLECERKVAYLIINYDEICINLISTNEVENEIPLLATLMMDADEVTIKIDDINLQEKIKLKYSIKETTYRPSNGLTINEAFLVGLTEDGWDNQEFIFKKLALYKDTYSYEKEDKQIAVELISFIPEKMWEDKQFIEKIFKNPFINKIFHHAIEKEKNKTFDVLYNTNILETLIEFDNKILITHYIKVYQEYMDKRYGTYCLKNDKNNYSLPSMIEKEEQFIPHIEKYFKQLMYAKKMINLVDNSNCDLFDPQLKKDDQFKEQYITIVLAELEKKASGYNPYLGNITNVLGVESFSDKRVQQFLLTHGHKSYDQSYKPLLANEILKNNNEEIIEVISQATNIDFLWDYFSKEQKEDKKIVSYIINQNPKIYNKLIESLKLDKEIFKMYYHTLKNQDIVKDFKVGKINQSFFNALNEDEIIDLIKVIPQFVLSEKFPEQYFNNTKVMAYTNIDYSVFKELKETNEVYKVTLKKVFDDKQLCMIMLSNNYNIFPFFSEKVRSDMEVLEAYIRKSYDYNNLPPKVFYNKNIILHILKSKPNFIDKVPEQYLKDQDFILRVFEKLDSKELNEQIITSLPIVINEIINTNQLKLGQYYEFFSKVFANMNLTEKLEPGKKEKIKTNKI